MKKIYFVLALSIVMGCGPTPDSGPSPVVANTRPPSIYDFYEAGRAAWTIEGEPVRLVQVKNRKTGKVYLLAYHDGIQAESMVKIDEWQEEPEAR